MTDQSSTEDDGDVTVRINLYPEEGETKALRQLGFGLQPFVLLEAEPDDEGNVVLAVVGSLIDDLDELVATLEGFTEAVKEAVSQRAAQEGQDA